MVCTQYVCMHVCVRVRMYASVQSMSEYSCLCACIGMLGCMSVRMHLCARVCVCVSVCVIVSVLVFLSASLSVSARVRVCVCVCACVSADVQACSHVQ